MDHQQSPELPHWRPLSPMERRVLGVMVEKSKTTPDIYPMTVKAITTASNQKNNRKPNMQLSVDEVVDALTDLREGGVVTEIHGDGRAIKYRHHLYDWLGVDRVELAVMAELFLRGEQTVGDLRGRSSRMEKIPDLAALQPVLASLQQKNLVIALTPPGRGQKLTHNLYEPQELAKLLSQQGGVSVAADPEIPVTRSADSLLGAAENRPVATGEQPADRRGESAWREQLQDQLAALEERVARLEQQLA